MIYGLIIVALILAAHIYKLSKFTSLKKKAISAMPEDERLMEEVQEEDYNGNDLFIRDEERTVWNDLTRREKRKIIKKQEKMIKSGRYIRVDGGIITRAEAKEKGLI